MITVLAIGKGSHESRLDLSLSARALGASEIVFTGAEDPGLERYVSRLNGSWGGRFRVSWTSDYAQLLKGATNYKTVYLTRFGIPLNKVRYRINTYKNIILIITLQEEFGQVHNTVDFNISITEQPHTSIASMAVFLHSYYSGRELAMHFENAKYKMVLGADGSHMERVERKAYPV